jgi:hypothetical protein
MKAPRESGRFIAGFAYSRETQFRPGEHRNPATEFRRVTIRIETHTGLPRAWVKVAEPNVWKKRAVVVWESLHGPLPRGQVVHHHDRNSLNDEPNNLQAMTRSQHIAEHKGETHAWRRAA